MPIDVPIIFLTMNLTGGLQLFVAEFNIDVSLKLFWASSGVVFSGIGLVYGIGFLFC